MCRFQQRYPGRGEGGIRARDSRGSPAWMDVVLASSYGAAVASCCSTPPPPAVVCSPLPMVGVGFIRVCTRTLPVV